MAFKMKGFSGFGNSPMKQEDIGATRPMTDEEKKQRTQHFQAPAVGPASIVKGVGKLKKAHTKLHKDHETIREATKATTPYGMGSMK